MAAQEPEPASFDVLNPVPDSVTEGVSPIALEGYEGEGSSGSGDGSAAMELPRPDLLYTIRDSDYSVTLVTHPLYGVVADLEDEYTCIAENEFATHQETIFLDVKGELLAV